MIVRDLHQRLCDLVHTHGDNEVLVVLHARDDKVQDVVDNYGWVTEGLYPADAEDDGFVVITARQEDA